jgi:opacity protein-like surface antigen
MHTFGRIVRLGTIFSGCLSIMLVTAAPASAQSVAEPHTVTVTPFLSTSFGVSQNLDRSLGFGAAVGYDLTSFFGVEFEFGHVFDVVNDDNVVDWSLTNYSVNGLYYFNVPRVTPYATFGFGWERSNPKYNVPTGPLQLSFVPELPQPTTEVAWNIGGGVKAEITDRLIARADLRRFQVNDMAPDHWRLYGGLSFFIKR